MTTGHCPSVEIVSAWLDGELGGAPARDFEAHLDGCEVCREKVLDWLQLSGEIAEASGTCIDGERLVAYADGTLRADESRRAREHLRMCPRCAREVREMRKGTVPSETVPSEKGTAPLAVATGGRQVRRVRGGRFAPLLRPGPLLSAAVVAALVIVVVARLLPSGRVATSDEVEALKVSPDAPALLEERFAPVPRKEEADRAEEPVQPREQSRGVAPAAPAELERGIGAEAKPSAGGVSKELAVSPPTKLSGRAGPDDAQAVVTTFLSEEIRGFRGLRGEWTLVQLRDGREVWVRSQELVAAGIDPRSRVPVWHLR